MGRVTKRSRSTRALAAVSKAPPDLLSAPQTGEELATRVLRSWRASLAEGTRRGYTGDLRAFGRWMLPEDALKAMGGDGEALELVAAGLVLNDGPVLARERARGWMGAMRQAGTSPATINRRLAALRSLVREGAAWGVEWSLSVQGPRVESYRDVTGPKPRKVEAAIRRMRRGAAKTACDARDLAIVLLLHDSALRRSSVAGLALGDLDLEAPCVWYIGKNLDQKRAKTISRRCVEAIEGWLRHRGREAGLLFRTIPGEPGRPSDGLTPDSINRITHRRGLGNAHGLRHAAATKLAKERGNVFEIKALLDHASVSTSQVYVDRADDLSGVATSAVAGELPDDG